MPERARSYAAILAIADRLVPSVRQRFFAAVRALQARISIAELERAAEQGTLTPGIMRQLETWPADLRNAAAVLNETMTAAGQQAARELAPDLRLTTSFDLTNPFAVQAAATRTGFLIREITEQQRLAIQGVLQQSIVEGIAPAQSARLIRPLIGLTERQMQAALRYRHELLEAGLSNERTERAFARYSAKLLRDRAENIARTETIRASVDGQLSLWRQAQADGLIGDGTEKQWIVTFDDRLCPRCRPLHGMKVRLEETFPGGVMGPPLHPRCLPGDALVSAGGQIAAVSERPFEGDLLVLKTASGKRLTCTPNHPVLTRHGWLAASLLNVGNEVLGQVRMQGVFGRDDDTEHVPTRFHEVAETFRRAPQMAAVEMPVAAKDFHGDGGGSEIAVIRSNRLLMSDLYAVSLQKTGHESFVAADVELLALDGLSVRELRGERDGSSASCRVCSSDLSLARGAVHTTPLEQLGFALSAGLDATLEQTSTNEPSINGQLPSERELRLAGEVFGDQIVDVDVLSGCHLTVFNMETERGWYAANGILTHNCRCALRIAVGTATRRRAA